MVLAIAGWLAARRLGGRTMFVLAYGALIVLLLSWVLGRRRIVVVANRSRLPTRVQQGQIVEVELELTAKRRLSTLILEEVLHPQLGRSVHIPIPAIPPGRKIRHVYTFAPRLRGVYEVGPLMAIWSDPFGVTKRRVTLTEPARIIVHPSTERVHDRVVTREWEDPPIRPPYSKPWPTGFEFYGMRDYVPGDDPRRIIWRASARNIDPATGMSWSGSTTGYLIRESEQGITDRIRLLLNTDIRRHSPGEPSETFETSVRAAASLGVRHLRDGFAVTLDTNAGRLANALRGQRSQIRLLDELAKVQLEQIPLWGSLERLMTESRTNVHNVLLTPHLDEKSARGLRLLVERGTSVTIVLVIWEETELETVHRAAAVGGIVVELDSGGRLEPAFRHVVGAGVRRERSGR